LNVPDHIQLPASGFDASGPLPEPLCGEEWIATRLSACYRASDVCRDQLERAASFIKIHVHRESIRTPKYAASALYNASFCPPYVDDYKPAGHDRAFIAKLISNVGIDDDMPYAQARSLVGNELQSSNGMLFFLNIGLLAGNRQLLVSYFGQSFASDGGLLCGIGGFFSGRDGRLHVAGLLLPTGRNQFHLALASPPKPHGSEPKANGRNGENDRKTGHDAFVVRFNEVVQPSKKDDRTRAEGGALFLFIVIGGLLAVFYFYQAGKGR